MYNQNAQRKCLGCRDVYMKSSNNLNYKSWINLLTRKEENEIHTRKYQDILNKNSIKEI